MKREGLLVILPANTQLLVFWVLPKGSVFLLITLGIFIHGKTCCSVASITINWEYTKFITTFGKVHLELSFKISL